MSNMDTLMKSKQKINRINHKISKVKPTVKKELKRRKRYDESHKRVTTYIERETVNEIDKLYDEGYLKSKAEFYNIACKQLLSKLEIK